VNIKKFRENLMRLICSQEGEESFHALRMQTGGLSSPKIAKIINYASKCCDPKTEVYVEIGTYSGYTLAAAGYQNNTQCIGIDDLSMKDFYSDAILEEKKEDCRKMIAKSISLVRNGAINFVEKDFRMIERLDFQPDPKKIAVFYIDGYHSYEQTKLGFEWGEPQLADEAIIIVDDLHMPQVYRSVLEQVFNGKYTILALMKHTPEDGDTTLDEYISTGLAVLYYKREPK